VIRAGSPEERTEVCQAAARIFRMWEACSARELADGLAWYDRAGRAAADLTPDCPARAAGVIAALSPQNMWSANLDAAGRVIRAADSLLTRCPSVHTTAMCEQAWRIARGGEDPLDVLNGPKVRAFYRNITGDLTAVTVDRWAARVALGTPRGEPAPLLHRQRYDRIARAYRMAAEHANVPPCHVQAAVWVHIRGKAD
jgi:hypothetical protein